MYVIDIQQIRDEDIEIWTCSKLKLESMQMTIVKTDSRRWGYNKEVGSGRAIERTSSNPSWRVAFLFIYIVDLQLCTVRWNQRYTQRHRVLVA